MNEFLTVAEARDRVSADTLYSHPVAENATRVGHPARQ